MGLFGDISKCASSIVASTAGLDLKLADLLGVTGAQFNQIADQLGGSSPGGMKQVMTSLGGGNGGSSLDPNQAKALVLMVQLKALEQQMKEIKEQLDDLAAGTHKPLSNPGELSRLLNEAMQNIGDDPQGALKTQQQMNQLNVLMQSMPSIIQQQGQVQKSVINNMR